MRLRFHGAAGDVTGAAFQLTTKNASVPGRLPRPVTCGTPVDVAPGITARFVDAGHILGSATAIPSSARTWW